MEYQDVVFADLRLMIGGGKLADVCKEFKVPEHLAKKEIDMHNFRTLSKVLAFVDEVKEYALNDVICMEYIYDVYKDGIYKDITNLMI